MKFKILVKKIRSDLFIASCPALKGCHVEAKSEEEAQKLITEAIKAYLISYKQHYEKPPIKQS